MNNDDKDLKRQILEILNDAYLPVKGDDRELVASRISRLLNVKTKQPSEPLKELDIHSVNEVIINKMGESNLGLADEICRTFGKPSEIKFGGYCPVCITKGIYHKSTEKCQQPPEPLKELPARKDVKWPLEYKPSPHNDGRDFYITDFEAGANEMLKACKKSYEEAMPAQRKVRYPEKKNYQGSTKLKDYIKGVKDGEIFGWNKAIDEMKKLNS